MWTAFSQIDEALATLGASEGEFRTLSVPDADLILRQVKDRYLGGKNPAWWWEHYEDGSFWRPGVEGYTLLPQLCPDETVFFIPHGEEVERVYVSTPATISRVLGECAHFEYSVVGKNLDWLLTETHHDSLVVVGERARQMLLKARGA